MSLLDNFHGQRFLTLEENDPLVKQSGGGDLPEPTIADTGKVLGVDNTGAYALVSGYTKVINMHFNENVPPEGTIDYLDEIFSPSDNIVALTLKFPDETSIFSVVSYQLSSVSGENGYIYYNEDGTSTPITQDTDVLIVNLSQESFIEQLIVDVSNGKCLYVQRA